MNELTKLDKFAIEAMNALISNQAIFNIGCEISYEDIAKDAYRIAKFMAEESEKQNKDTKPENL